MVNILVQTCFLWRQAWSERNWGQGSYQCSTFLNCRASVTQGWQTGHSGPCSAMSCRAMGGRPGPCSSDCTPAHAHACKCRSLRGAGARAQLRWRQPHFSSAPFKDLRSTIAASLPRAACPPTCHGCETGLPITSYQVYFKFPPHIHSEVGRV